MSVFLNATLQSIPSILISYLTQIIRALYLIATTHAVFHLLFRLIRQKREN